MITIREIIITERKRKKATMKNVMINENSKNDANNNNDENN